MSHTPRDEQSFEDAAANAGGGVFADFCAFMVENAKWWMIPIFIVLFLLGALVVIGGTGAAPFIYTLF